MNPREVVFAELTHYSLELLLSVMFTRTQRKLNRRLYFYFPLFFLHIFFYYYYFFFLTFVHNSFPQFKSSTLAGYSLHMEITTGKKQNATACKIDFVLLLKYVLKNKSRRIKTKSSHGKQLYRVFEFCISI